MSLDLAKIGGLLKEAREAKGLGLEDISDALYLRKSIIDALESGNWDRLPHEVYVKGYLNQYASHLGVEKEIAEASRMLPEPEVLPVPVTSEPQDYRPPKKHTAEKPGNAYPKRRFAIYGVSIAILLAFLAFQNMDKRFSPPAPTGAYTVSNTAYEPKPKPSEGSVTVLELKKLVVACHERTWIRIVIDETEKKEFMLNPEEMVAFNAKEGFDLLIGNAGGVTLFYNGRNIGFEGDNGEVKRVKLP